MLLLSLLGCFHGPASGRSAWAVLFSLDHPTGRPLGQYSANVVNEHAMFFAVSYVADSIPTQPSIPANLLGSRFSFWTDGRRCRVFGRCLRARAYPGIRTQDSPLGTQDSPLPVCPAQRRDLPCLRARGTVGRYGPWHEVAFAPYRGLRIRPTVARQELPDGRRVTGPIGSGEDTASFIAPGLSYGRSGPG